MCEGIVFLRKKVNTIENADKTELSAEHHLVNKDKLEYKFTYSGDVEDLPHIDLKFTQLIKMVTLEMNEVVNELNIRRKSNVKKIR
jgi:hypothetical protein